MSEELYKNSVNVGVPGLRKRGLDKALALVLLPLDVLVEIDAIEVK